MAINLTNFDAVTALFAHIEILFVFLVSLCTCENTCLLYCIFWVNGHTWLRTVTWMGLSIRAKEQTLSLTTFIFISL